MGLIHRVYSNNPRRKRKRRGPRKLRSKLKSKPRNIDLTSCLDSIELLNNQQLKRAMKNPKGFKKPSGKRKTKVLKRLRQDKKEKNTMQVDTEVEASTSKIQSKKVTSKKHEVSSKMEDDPAETVSSDSEYEDMVE